MSSSDVPEPWATRMRERGFTDPRYKHDVPSMSRLAERAGIHTSTVSAVISGRRKPGPDTVAALVDLLGPDVQDWLGVRVELGPYVPPAESALLTKPQREAMTALIRAIASEQRAGDGDAEHAASKTRAGETPAAERLDKLLRPITERGIAKDAALGIAGGLISVHAANTVDTVLGDDEPTGDYILAASDVDDDPEVEAWQEEP